MLLSKPTNTDRAPSFAYRWLVESATILASTALVVLLIISVGIFVGIGWHISARFISDRLPVRAPTVFIDPATGCHYMQLGDAVLFPRFGPDGHPMCPEVSQ